MKIPTDYCTDQRKETMVNIISDAIIFERIYKGMQEAVKAARPTENWDPANYYNGISNAWIFLTIYEFPEEVDEELKEELSEIFFDWFKEDFKKHHSKRETAKKLAEHIYIDWEYCINSTEKDQGLKSA